MTSSRGAAVLLTGMGGWNLLSLRWSKLPSKTLLPFTSPPEVLVTLIDLLFNIVLRSRLKLLYWIKHIRTSGMCVMSQIWERQFLTLTHEHLYICFVFMLNWAHPPAYILTWNRITELRHISYGISNCPSNFDCALHRRPVRLRSSSFKHPQTTTWPNCHYKESY